MATVIEWLSDSLIAGSIVMVIVMLVRGLALRRMPRRYAYLLWAVVAIRLLCPVILPSPVSVFNFVPEITLMQDHVTERSTPSTETIKPTRDITARQSDTKAVGSETYYKEDTNESIEKPFTKQETRDTEVTTKNERKQPALAEKITPASVGEKETATETTGISTLLLILFVLWITGVVVFLSKNIIDGIRLQKKLRTAVRLEKGVYESDRIDTPFVKGIIRPRIYIPFRLSDTEKECILAHERHHIRRGDPVFKLLATVLLAVYWFHPLVWVSYRLMVRDMEMSCDEYVLAHEKSDIRAAYSTLLLAFATNRRIVDGVLFFGENDTKQRVKHIMKFKKKNILFGVLATFIVITVTACTLTGKAADDNSSKSTTDAASGSAVTAGAVSGVAVSETTSDIPGVDVPITRPNVNILDGLGATLLVQLYADKDRGIFLLNGGLFVYDKQNREMVRTLDLVPIDCQHIQGEIYTDIMASKDGRFVYMNTNNCDDQYIYDIDADVLRKTSHKEFEKNEPEYYDDFGDGGECRYESDGKTYIQGVEYGDSCVGGIHLFDYYYSEEDTCGTEEYNSSYFSEDKQAIFLDEKYRKASLLNQEDIHDITKMEMFIEGEMREVTDGSKLKRVEKAIQKAGRNSNYTACDFKYPAYVTMADGSFGMIYPAMDGCDTFILADGEYTIDGSIDNKNTVGLCMILDWTEAYFSSIHVPAKDGSKKAVTKNILLEDVSGDTLHYRETDNWESQGIVADDEIESLTYPYGVGYGKKKSIKLSDDFETIIFEDIVSRAEPQKTDLAGLNKYLKSHRFFKKRVKNGKEYYIGVHYIMTMKVRDGKCSKLEIGFQVA